MTSFEFITDEINALTAQMYQIKLKPKSGKMFDFKPGQYLLLQLNAEQKIPLSIASAPEQEVLELHIRVMHQDSIAAEMLALFECGETILIEAPFGECVLPATAKSIIMIVGGTGFAPVKSMLESALVSAQSTTFKLYVGAQTQQDLYQTAIVEQWTYSAEQFLYVPVIGEEDSSWTGEIGFPHLIAIRDNLSQLNQCEFIISGSEAMVLNVYQALLAEGVTKTSIHSDILDIKRASGDLE